VAYEMSLLQVDEYPLAPPPPTSSSTIDGPDQAPHPPPLTRHDPPDPILQFEEDEDMEDDFSSQGSAGHAAPRWRCYPAATRLQASSAMGGNPIAGPSTHAQASAPVIIIPA
jgi:hypothetical protein